MWCKVGPAGGVVAGGVGVRPPGPPGVVGPAPRPRPCTPRELGQGAGGGGGGGGGEEEQGGEEQGEEHHDCLLLLDLRNPGYLSQVT